MTTTVCFAILTCMIVAAVLGLNLFLFPIYALSGRVTTLRRAAARCAKGEGTIVYLRGAGLFDRVWWIQAVPTESVRLRLRGTIVLSIRSEPRLREVVPMIETVRTKTFGFVDPVKLEEKREEY